MEENKNILQSQTNQKADTIDLSEIFWSYFSYWRWILFSVLFALIVGYFLSKMQTDVYQINSSVLIKTPEKGESSLLKDLGVESTKNIENEAEVFRSKRLLNSIVDSLNLNVSYYYKTVLNQYTELYKFSPVRISIERQFLSELENGVVFLTFTQANEGYTVKYEKGTSVIEKSFSRFPFTLHSSLGPITITSTAANPKLIRPLIVSIRSTQSVIGSINIQSSINKNNEIIALSTTSLNPVKGVDILNAVIDSYNRDAMMQMNQSAINTANFIAERIRILTVELSDVEKDVETYKRVNKISESINTEENSYLQKSSESDVKKIEMETQFQLVSFVEDFIINDKNLFSPIPNVPLADEGLSGMVSRYNELVVARQKLMSSSTSDNPVFISLNKELSAFKNTLLQSVKHTRSVLQYSKNEMQKINSNIEGKLNELPRQEREFVELKRQQRIKEQLYIFLLQKREESALTMALTVPKAIVINEASSSGLISVTRKTILMYAFIFGLFFPLLIIYLINLFNTKIFIRKDVESLTDIPIISEMAHSESKLNFAVTENGLDSTTELFRLLRTKLNFILDHPKDKVILITSTEPGEGKTFISVNLALGLAMTDKKVLLVGMDLRKPQLSERFGIQQKEGITSFLSHQEADVDTLIFQSPDYPNLDVLHSGIIPPNPNELLMKNELGDIFDKFREKYDYIIMDSAPVGVVSDTLLLLKISDIVLYICRSGFTAKKSFEVINRLQEEYVDSRLYLIINDLSLRKKYYKYRYKYGYGYGYGYGSGGRRNKDKSGGDNTVIETVINKFK
ncbi:MAG: polysaccharide biosynthesis tyrosine autokinase [Bacteroidales bacterium]|nr:polysaccharide biosynthesis tyrosine autokinase [Bacteroidales bacterium]